MAAFADRQPLPGAARRPGVIWCGPATRGRTRCEPPGPGSGLAFARRPAPGRVLLSWGLFLGRRPVRLLGGSVRLFACSSRVRGFDLVSPFRAAERANGRTARAPGAASAASRAGFRVVVLVRPVFARLPLGVRRRPRWVVLGPFLGVRLFVRPRVSVQRANSPAAPGGGPGWRSAVYCPPSSVCCIPYAVRRIPSSVCCIPSSVCCIPYPGTPPPGYQGRIRIRVRCLTFFGNCARIYMWNIC
jgi:hypothetical protein